MTDEFVPSLTYDLVYREGIVAARFLVIGAESLRRFVIRDELKPFVEQTRAAGVAGVISDSCTARKCCSLLISESKDQGNAQRI